MQGMERNKSNRSKIYLGRLQDSEVARLSPSVISVLSNFLYLELLGVQTLSFLLG